LKNKIILMSNFYTFAPIVAKRQAPNVPVAPASKHPAAPRRKPAAASSLGTDSVGDVSAPAVRAADDAPVALPAPDSPYARTAPPLKTVFLEPEAENKTE
jgi:hypothetical protein